MKEKNYEPNLIVFANQSYTALEKDVVSVVVNNLDTGFNVQPDLFSNKTITVTANMLNVDTKQYHQLKKVALSLKKKEINIINDEKEEFDLITPFPRIKYKTGKLEITMFADVMPHFLELKKGYTEYYLKESLSLHGFRTKRLYELFSAKKNLRKPEWKVYDNELKGLLNIKLSSYKGRPAEFEEKQITPNVEEINEKTSLDVFYNRDKDEGGWFTFFKIIEKPKAIQNTFIEPKKLDERSQRCYTKLNGMGVRKDFINKIIDNHQDEFWQWLHKNREELKNKKFRNPAGVLLVHLGLVEPKF